MKVAIEYITLECLASRLNLPQNYLKQLADLGEIPRLLVGGRRRFMEEHVRDALRILAEKGQAFLQNPPTKKDK